MKIILENSGFIIEIFKINQLFDIYVLLEVPQCYNNSLCCNFLFFIFLKFCDVAKVTILPSENIDPYLAIN
jgi:hypothetical protein